MVIPATATALRRFLAGRGTKRLQATINGGDANKASRSVVQYGRAIVNREGIVGGEGREEGGHQRNGRGPIEDVSVN